MSVLCILLWASYNICSFFQWLISRIKSLIYAYFISMSHDFIFFSLHSYWNAEMGFKPRQPSSPIPTFKYHSLSNELVHMNVKAMVFPVVMYRYKSWTIKKAEHQKIDAFELCWWWFSFSVVSDSCNHMDCHQAPLSMEPSRQKHRSGLPFPSLPLTCSAGENLKSLLDSKEIKPVNPKGNQPWLFIGRTDSEAEAPILWPADGKSRLTGKDPDAREDWGQEEKGTTEDEMVGWLPPTQWTWVWANSGRQWRTGRPGVLQSMGLKSRHMWMTEQVKKNGKSLLWMI